MNYCVYCGMKLETNFRVCPGCGTPLGNGNPNTFINQPISYSYPSMGIYQNQVVVPPEKVIWKDVLSIIFNLLALYFCFIVYHARQELYFEQVIDYGGVSVPYVIGVLCWQIGFSVSAFCLSISSRKRKESYFNLINIIFSAIIFAITIIEFGILISYSA